VDFNKLQQFDINNLDTGQIISLLEEHKNSIIMVVVVVGSLFLAGSMFNNYRTKTQALHVQLTQLQEKLDAIKVNQAALNSLNNFKSGIPKNLNEYDLISLISDDAKLYHVDTPSLSPAGIQNMGLYDVINVSFSATADNFKDMMLFLRKIEKSEFPLRIDSWSSVIDQPGEGTINFNIKMSAVLLHP